MKPEERQKAISLRQEGKSYREIMTLVGVSKSSLSLWLRDVELRDDQRNRLSQIRGSGGGKAKKQAWEAKRIDVMKGYDPPLHDPQFMLGLGLYWGEGSKYSRCMTTFTNSDPTMLKAFVVWVNKFYADNFERFSVEIHHYDSMRDAEIKQYWSKLLDVPVDHFIKSQVQVSRLSQRKRGNTLPYGTAKVHLRGKDSWRVRVKIQKALDLVQTRYGPLV